MGRLSCCVKQKQRKGLWSPEEDEKLYNYIKTFGVGCWSSVPKLAGLERCGKSCRLRWINYLRPDLKRGMLSQEEEDLIISLHKVLGNRWAQIATQFPGRTDNEIKNFWNSSLKKKLIKQGIDPITHVTATDIEVKNEKDYADSSSSLHILQSKGLPNSTNPSQTGQESYSLICSHGEQIQQYSTENFETKQVNDPLFLSEFQESMNPDGYHSNFPYQQQNPVEENPIMNPNYGLDSMTDLVENSDTFSSGVENNLESVFEFQFGGIQNDGIQNDGRRSRFWEEGKQQIQNQSLVGFCNYQLTSLSQEFNGEILDVFQQM